jgi:hypothetical protein
MLLPGRGNRDQDILQVSMHQDRAFPVQALYVQPRKIGSFWRAAFGWR